MHSFHILVFHDYAYLVRVCDIAVARGIENKFSSWSSAIRKMLSSGMPVVACSVLDEKS